MTISREEYRALLENNAAANAWEKRCVAVKEECSALQTEVAQLTAQLNWALEQIRLATHMVSGPSKESIPEAQKPLFNEVEQECDSEKVMPEEQKVAGYKRKKKRGHRKEMFEGLDEETIEYRLSEEEQVCPDCGERLPSPVGAHIEIPIRHVQ